MMRLKWAALLAAMCAAASSARCEEQQNRAEAAANTNGPVKTGKERLARKWNDEQRVDNCKVPAALRGPRPRPDGCAGGAGR